MNTIYSKFYRAVLYPESSDLQSVCTNLQTIGAQYCYILHDRDVESKENGEITYKKPHWHFIIMFQKPKSSKMLCNALGVHMVYSDIPLASTEDTLLRYLVHLDEPVNVEIPKTRYNFDEVHCCSDYMQKRFNDACNAPVTFDLESSKTEEETLFDDLERYFLRELTLKELLLAHPKYIKYFNSLASIYFAIYHIEISGIIKKSERN